LNLGVLIQNKNAEQTVQSLKNDILQQQVPDLFSLMKLRKIACYSNKTGHMEQIYKPIDFIAIFTANYLQTMP